MLLGKHLAKLQSYLSSRLLPSDLCLSRGFDGVTAPDTIDLSQVAASGKDNTTRAVLDALNPGKPNQHFGPIFMDDPFTVRLTPLQGALLSLSLSLSLSRARALPPFPIGLRLHLSVNRGLQTCWWFGPH
eukprot:SAG11_NODE_479_length_9108_cov_3.699856_5_plen_130_part_00